MRAAERVASNGSTHHGASNGAKTGSALRKPLDIVRAELAALVSPRKTKRAEVLEVIESIHKARQKNASFADITRTLCEGGLKVGERTVRRAYELWLDEQEKATRVRSGGGK